MQDKTAELLQKLADKFGTTTEKLWMILVSQAKVQVFIYSIEMIISLMVIIFFIRYLFICLKEWNNDHATADDDPNLFFVIIWSIVSGICLFIIIAVIGSFITCIVNPEYWALTEILNSIKPSN